MTAPVSNIPVSVDYTSRDYYALREDLIEVVKLRVNTDNSEVWTGADSSDFGLALIEAFAYVGDVVNYYLDRITNETYLPTATQRKNVLNLANQFGYEATGYRAAELEITFTNESTEDSYDIPLGTQVRGGVVCDDVVQNVVFTTLELVTVEPESTVVARAAHGELASMREENASSGAPGDIAGEFVGTSNGSANQRFVLSENQVVDGSVVVYVENGDIFEPWTRVTHLSDYGPFSAVYSLTTDENNFVSVVFGDGVSGFIPTRDERIKVDYSIGGGTIGNISQQVLSEVYRVPGLTTEELQTLKADVTATNTTVGLGGADPEDSFSIRKNAPKVIRAINRAVSLEDYATLALSQTNVGKANAAAEVWSSVTVYAAPIRNVNDTELYPGYNASNSETTSEWDAIQSSIENYLSDKIQIGTSVTVAPPKYVDVAASISFTAATSYTNSQAAADIQEQLLVQYTYANNSFAQVITPEDIERELNSLASVRNARVVSLYRDGADEQRAPLIGGASEIFVFSFANITVSAASNDASLSGITVDDGSLSPAFATDFYTYNVVGVTSDTLTITPSTTDTTATVTVNGTSAATAVDTPASSVTTIPVVVTASDGLTVKVYTLIVSRT